MPIRLLHRREHCLYEFIRYAGVKQVGHRVDENPARSLPSERKRNPFLPEAKIEPLLVVMARNAPPPFREG
jgi:hypothetical protein